VEAITQKADARRVGRKKKVPISSGELARKIFLLAGRKKK